MGAKTPAPASALALENMVCHVACARGEFCDMAHRFPVGWPAVEGRTELMLPAGGAPQCDPHHALCD